MEKLKVLVVDDEPGIRSGIIRILNNFSVGYPFMDEDFEFTLIDTGSGEEAIDIITNNEIDIVLLDNKLPGMDGIEVLEFMKKSAYKAEVMMITSYASLDLAVKATNNGAYNFVPKPFTPQELKAAMESITKHLFLKRMTQAMKEEGKQVRFQFLSVLSHELKSPINAIEGYLQIMQEKQAGADIDAYKVMIDRSIDRLKGMRTLIIDLLDLTKIESGKKTRDIKQVDIAEIIRIAKDTMEPVAIQRNVKVYFDSDEIQYITGDAEELEIIMNNLISNAIKYNKENGEVYVQIKPGNGKVEIKVRDTGIGMTEEEISKLFQEFVRIKNAKTKNITGSGLGLSIMKKMVDLYNGDIIVESEPDVGSQFKVILPQNNMELKN
jgi:signal transduction histidine kinase